MRKSSLVNVFLAGTLFASCVMQAAEPSLQTTALSADMDTSIKPGDDFFAYANGNWGTLAHYLGTTLRADIDILNTAVLRTDHVFGLWAAQDLDDPLHYAPFLVQGGLGMPDRKYYVSDSPHMRDLQQLYRSFIANLLRLSGVPVHDAEAQAARIYDLEQRIAEVHVNRADSNDVQRGHNHWSREDFSSRAPGLDWSAFFAGAQLAKQATFVVWQPTAVIGISALAKSVPISTWKEYLKFHAIDHFAGFLPKAFVVAHFAFYGTTLQGTPQLPERWKRAVDDTNEALGDGVGRLYAQARTQAKAKLAALKVGVGYTDQWIDYSSLKVLAGDAYGAYPGMAFSARIKCIRGAFRFDSRPLSLGIGPAETLHAGRMAKVRPTSIA
jgi:predicted metalloendopeptidase